MKKQIVSVALTSALAFGATSAQALPTLQLGSYAEIGSGQGTYVDYTDLGADEDTAFIGSGYTLLAAGSY